MGHVRGHAPDGGEALGLDEPLLGAQLLGHVVHHHEHRAARPLGLVGPERRHEHVEESQLVRGHLERRGHERRALAALGHRLDGLGEPGQALEQAGPGQGRVEVRAVDAHHGLRGAVRGAHEPVGPDDDHPRAEAGDDLLLHALELAQSLRRVAQLPIARADRVDHALELRRELTDLVVARGGDLAREVALRDGDHALLQTRERSQQPLRPPEHDEPEEERGHDEPRDHVEELALLLGRGPARLRDAPLHGSPRVPQAARDLLLVQAEILEHARGRVLVAALQRLEERVEARLSRRVGGEDRLEIGAHLGEVGRVVGRGLEQLRPLHGAERAVHGRGSHAARGLEPGARGRRVALGQHAVEQGAEDRLRRLRLTDGEREREVALVQEAQPIRGALVLVQARRAHRPEGHQDQDDAQEDPRGDRQPRPSRHHP